MNKCMIVLDMKLEIEQLFVSKLFIKLLISMSQSRNKIKGKNLENKLKRKTESIQKTFLNNKNQRDKMQPPALTKSTSQLSKWKPYKSWRYPRDLLRSIPEMSVQELDLNLVEINLCGYYNEDVLEMVENKMLETGFYLRNRWVLQSLVNGEARDKAVGEKIGNIVKRFDDVFVGGGGFGDKIDKSNKNKEIGTELNEEAENKQKVKQDLQHYTNATEQSSLNNNTHLITRKQSKLKFIKSRQNFILQLSTISDRLFECKQGKTEEEIFEKKKQIFYQQLEELNRMIEEYKGDSDVKYLEEEFGKKVSIKESTTSSQQPKQQIKPQPNSQTLPYSLPPTPFTLLFHHHLHPIFHISIPNSTFIPTKNRNPLKLDLGFGEFIYKNDDQLAHEIIAMQFMKYMNKVFGGEFVQEYEILPEVRGAFYECVNARTVADVKKEYQDLQKYFKALAEERKVDLSVIQKRFAQSYAGYCIAQFMLQIKDRNNSNIMLKPDGTFFHIDLAFIFNAKPGGISFQSAPFKMTKQYVKAMGGFDSDQFKYFESLLIQMITKLYESKQEFLCKLDILGSRSKEIRCFSGFDIQKYRNAKIVKSLDKARQFVEHLIDQSFDNWRTKKYDTYQWKTNKIPV